MWTALLLAERVLQRGGGEILHRGGDVLIGIRVLVLTFCLGITVVLPLRPTFQHLEQEGCDILQDVQQRSVQDKGTQRAKEDEAVRLRLHGLHEERRE